MKEKWTRWKPTSNLVRQYYVDSITYEVEDKFNIILSHANNDLSS